MTAIDYSFILTVFVPKFGKHSMATGILENWTGTRHEAYNEAVDMICSSHKYEKTDVVTMFWSLEPNELR